MRQYFVRRVLWYSLVQQYWKFIAESLDNPLPASPHRPDKYPLPKRTFGKNKPAEKPLVPNIGLSIDLSCFVGYNKCFSYWFQHKFNIYIYIYSVIIYLHAYITIVQTET